MRSSSLLGRTVQAMDAASRSERCILAAAAKGEQSVTREAARPQRDTNASSSPAVRSRGEQHHVRRQRAQRGNRVVALRVRRHTVRFVHDHDVPAARERRRQHLRTLHVVDRCDRDRHGRPRVDAHGQLRRAASGLAHVDERGVDAESVAELPGPLLAQTGRGENEHAIRGASRHELGHDQAGLNRLSEADFIRDEHPRAEAANHRQRRFELVRQRDRFAPAERFAACSRVRARRRARGTDDASGASARREGEPAVPAVRRCRTG